MKKTITLFGLIILLLISGMVWSNYADAGLLQVSQNTSSDIINMYPQLDDEGRVAWVQSHEGSDNKVMFYDGQKASEIASSKTYPWISLSNGKLAWTEGDSTSGFKIKFYDGQKAIELGLSKGYPRLEVDNGKLAWTEGDSASGFRIKFYDGQKATELGSSKESPTLEINDGKLAFTAGDIQNGYRLKYYNGQKVIDLGSVYQYSEVQFDNGNLAWMSGDAASGYKLNIYNGLKVNEIAAGKNGFRYQLDNGRLAWTTGDAASGYKLNMYDGLKVNYIAGAANMIFKMDNGHLAWNTGSQLYIYDGQQARLISNINNVGLWNWQLENGTMTWVDTDDVQAKLYYYDGQKTRQLASATGIGLLGLNNGQIAWRQSDGAKLDKVCLFDGNQVATIADYGNGSPGYLSFINGRILYCGMAKQLYLYSTGSYTAAESSPATALPELDYSDLKAGTEQAIMSQLKASYQALSEAQKQDAECIEAITNYSEYGLSQIIRSTVSVADGQITLEQSSIAAAEQKARSSKAQIEQEMAQYNIVLNREMQTELPLIAEQWQGGAVNIVVDKNLIGMVSVIDSVRIEGQESGVVFSLPAVQDELKSSGELAVRIEKEAAEAAVGAEKQSVARLACSDIRQFNLLGQLYQEQPGIQIAGLKQTLYNIVFNNKASSKISNNVKISLPKASGDVEYQAVFKVEGSSPSAIGGKYNQASERIEIPMNQSGKYYVAENQQDFSDIKNKPQEVQKAIKVLASKGIITGYNNKFNPDASISRAEIVALMIKTLYKQDKNLEAGFTDVPASAWYYSYAASSRKHNIVTGYPDNTFRGTKIINKEQITAICGRTLKQEKKYKEPGNPDTYLKFSDKSQIAGWARGDVSLASREGLVIKRQDGTFRGSSGMTRADAALVLYRLFNRL